MQVEWRQAMNETDELMGLNLEKMQIDAIEFRQGYWTGPATIAVEKPLSRSFSKVILASFADM